MQKMSGTHLALVVRELFPFQGKRIARIRKTPNGLFLFKIGDSELLVQPGVRLHLTRQSLQATETPDGFVGFLRKNLEGKTADKISQHGADRILEITTRSKERLVIEMFRKGNIIVVSESGEIMACLEREEAGGRKIARGVLYEYPKATGFELKFPEKIGFRVKIGESGEPFSYSGDAESGGQEFSSFSEALDFYYANQRVKSEGQKVALERLRSLQNRLALQEKALERSIGEKKVAKEEGDAIYANFEKVETLLKRVREMKKAGKSDKEIADELKVKVKGAKVEVEL